MPSPRRHAFTMIELLVVIGIILILIGLFAAGAKIVTAQAKERNTRTMLQTCQTMWQNYHQATNLTRVPATYQTTVGGNVMTLNMTVCNYGAVFTSSQPVTAQFWTLGQEWAPGVEYAPTYPGTSISPDALHLNDPNLGDRPQVNTAVGNSGLPQAVVNTELVMHALLSIPENQSILNNLPPQDVLRDAVTGIPLILDGWGNPILFVPAGGLKNVFTTPDVTNNYNSQVVTSNNAEINPTTGQPTLGWDPTNPAGQQLAIQPFFVSAGPDGDLSNVHNHGSAVLLGAPIGASLNPPSASNASVYKDISDDNIYSFQ